MTCAARQIVYSCFRGTYVRNSVCALYMCIFSIRFASLRECEIKLAEAIKT